MKFRPLHDRVVIRRVDEAGTSKGGIIIPDTAKEKPMEGEIVAVGPGRPRRQGRAGTARRQDGRPHPVRQVVRQRDQARRPGPADHDRGRCPGRHRAHRRRHQESRLTRTARQEQKEHHHGCKRSPIRRRRPHPPDPRRRYPGRRGQGDARPQGPQRRARQVLWRAAHHQGRRDGRQGDRAFGQVREHGRPARARSRDPDLRHRRRRHHHGDRARPGDRARRRQVGRRRHEPDGPQARHRHGGRARDGGAQDPLPQGLDQRGDRPGRHGVGQRRQGDRRHAGQGDGQGRQGRRHHGRGGQELRDRARGGRRHAVRPRLPLALLHHQRREDDLRARESLHPASTRRSCRACRPCCRCSRRSRSRAGRCSSSPRRSRARRSPPWS